MLESLLVTLLPASFLAILIGSGNRFRSRNIDMDGEPPINRAPFLASKYLIVVVWLAMALRSWDIILPIELTHAIKGLSLVLWTAGFGLLFAGRFGLGDSFRIGSSAETTSLRVHGLFALSRNPMYVGVYTTLLAAFLYTLNPLLFLTGAFIVLVHHRIVLAEEQHLREVFGEKYLQYCSRVRRYL
jgi:protein-S-isoprenylcysteine O-methyltransferase Ste14